MNKLRWTLGVVLAAAVSTWGLVEANASPFSMMVLADDLGNVVHGSAPDASSDSSGGGESGTSSGGSSSDGADSSGSGKSNNGHGNNADGVDSSNPSNGKGGPNGEADASCPEGGTCIDDESKGGSTDSGADTSSDGKAKGKKK